MHLQTEAPKEPSGKRRRQENRGAEGAERGEVCGGVSPPQPTIGGPGSFPNGVLSGAPATAARNAFWRILKATEVLFAPIC